MRQRERHVLPTEKCEGIQADLVARIIIDRNENGGVLVGQVVQDHPAKHTRHNEDREESDLNWKQVVLVTMKPEIIICIHDHTNANTYQGKKQYP